MSYEPALICPPGTEYGFSIWDANNSATISNVPLARTTQAAENSVSLIQSLSLKGVLISPMEDYYVYWTNQFYLRASNLTGTAKSTGVSSPNSTGFNDTKVAWTSNGKVMVLASGNSASGLRYFSVPDWVEIPGLVISNAIQNVSIGGARLATANQTSYNVNIYDLVDPDDPNTWTVLRTIPHPTNQATVTGVGLSPDGKSLAVSYGSTSTSGVVVFAIFDVETGALRFSRTYSNFSSRTAVGVTWIRDDEVVCWKSGSGSSSAPMVVKVPIEGSPTISTTAWPQILSYTPPSDIASSGVSLSRDRRFLLVPAGGYFAVLDLLNEVSISTYYAGISSTASVIGKIFRAVSNEDTTPVTDASGNPVSGVKVYLLHRESGTLTDFAYTDGNGRFKLYSILGGQKVALFLGVNENEGAAAVDRIIPE